MCFGGIGLGFAWSAHQMHQNAFDWSRIFAANEACWGVEGGFWGARDDELRMTKFPHKLLRNSSPRTDNVLLLRPRSAQTEIVGENFSA